MAQPEEPLEPVAVLTKAAARQPAVTAWVRPQMTSSAVGPAVLLPLLLAELQWAGSLVQPGEPRVVQEQASTLEVQTLPAEAVALAAAKPLLPVLGEQVEVLATQAVLSSAAPREPASTELPTTLVEGDSKSKMGQRQAASPASLVAQAAVSWVQVLLAVAPVALSLLVVAWAVSLAEALPEKGATVKHKASHVAVCQIRSPCIAQRIALASRWRVEAASTQARRLPRTMSPVWVVGE